ncbi:hypothetical protein ONZ51_g11083 [Trametes cubensis]|uniref:Tf2-1-like SH3-like domain-containing protein n=1 Tax=Trametes cubensis TaxID=1111947 RepID=A0AAD7X6M5_9APHY|nr:hypothetical protein ONZ51_g11083 [Trametes cubensis]
MNQEIETYLRIFTNHRQDDWPNWLPLAAFAYRNRVHSATGYSPFFMTHGHHPHTGMEVKSSVPNESAEQFASRMKAIQQRASEALVKAKDAMKRKYDQHKRESRNYQIGDWVYIDATHLRTDRPTKKFEDKRYGPFQMEKKVGAAAYQLKLPRNLQPRASIYALTPAMPGPAIHSASSAPSPHHNPRSETVPPSPTSDDTARTQDRPTVEAALVRAHPDEPRLINGSLLSNTTVPIALDQPFVPQTPRIRKRANITMTPSSLPIPPSPTKPKYGPIAPVRDSPNNPFIVNDPPMSATAKAEYRLSPPRTPLHPSTCSSLEPASTHHERAVHFEPPPSPTPLPRSRK